MNATTGLVERDLAPLVARLRTILASEEFAEERHRRAAVRRALHESAAGLELSEITTLVERIRARFPDRTYESLALARELEARNRELEAENERLRSECGNLAERLTRTEEVLDALWGRIVSAGGGARGAVGGSGAAAPRRPELLAPTLRACADLVAFSEKLETIALEVERSLGPRGPRPIDPPSIGELWRALARNEGDPEAHLARLRDKLGYLGLLPAAAVAGASQSWRGGTRLVLEHLDPEKVEEGVAQKLPVLRDKAVLDEVRQRFQLFWSQLDDNVSHYYRGTFEKVYAQKMEEGR